MLQWELERGIAIGPLKLGMTRAQVAELNAEIGEPQPIKEMYGILWEDRPGGIATQYMNEKLVSVNICPWEQDVVSVFYDGNNMFDSNARAVLKYLESKNIDVPYVGSRDVFFNRIKVAATFYYDRLADEYYEKTPEKLDPRHIAIYLPEYVANVLPLTQRMKLPLNKSELRERRQWDYPFGVNLNYTPRSDSQLSFAELRALADALPLLRTVIETRKDQIAALGWAVRPIGAGGPGASQRIAATLAFLARPDRRHGFNAWLRMWLEDMLVIDAACLYPRFTRGGDLHSLDVIDGATIAPLIGEDGRAPEPPDPAYQQILHGVPAADFAADELLYLPRNVRSLRIPTQSGRGFRFEIGQRSDLIPATIPI